jgi:hypothetical protein
VESEENMRIGCFQPASGMVSGAGFFPNKEKQMKKASIGLALAVAVCAGTAFVQADPMAQQVNDVRVAGLVQDMNGLSMSALESLDSIPMEPYQVPTASADVMRVRLSETYAIDGIGEDTVELTGWIAVRHGAPRLAPGERELRWGTFVVDTEFVGLRLEGESEIFGKVVVTLDGERPAIGQVGRIEIPEQAQILLASTDTQTEPAPTTEEENTDDAACRAPVNVKVTMPELDLEMKTREPAVWHSRVTTIPPVGHEASVTIDPVSLVSNGRQVGTLISGTVKFREVVRKVDLEPSRELRTAGL